jgi:hypothetical protein
LNFLEVHILDMEGEEPKVDPPAEAQPEMEAPAEGDPAMEGMDAEREGAPAEEGASPDAQPADAMEGEMEAEMEPQEDFSQDTRMQEMINHLASVLRTSSKRTIGRMSTITTSRISLRTQPKRSFSSGMPLSQNSTRS